MLKKGYINLALAMVFVGSSFVVAKTLTNDIPVFLTNSLRFIIATASLLPLLVKRRKQVLEVSFRDLRRLFLLALTGVFLFNVLLFMGLKHLNASTAGIITSFSPIVLAFLSFLLLHERLTNRKILAIITATLGVFMVNIFPTESSSGNGFSLPGFSLIFGVVLCEAAFTLIAKTVSKRVSAEVMTGIVSCFSALLFVPLGLWQGLHFSLSTLSLKDWLLIAYLGVVVNAITYFLWYSGLKKATAVQAAVFTGIMPISAVVLSYIFLGESLNTGSILGLILVIAGVLLVTSETQSRV